MRDAGADDGGKDGGGENSDAVGAEVLQKPRHRSEDGTIEVCLLKQRGPGRLSALMLTALIATLRAMQNDFSGIRRIAQKKSLGCRLGLLDTAVKHQPQRTLDDEETADDDRYRKHEGAGIHPPPRRDVGVLEQNHKTDGCAHRGAYRLKAERPQHHSATNAAWNAFGNDQVGGGIIAPERDADADQ